MILVVKSNQQPQPQDPTPVQDRRIMRRTRAQGREAKDKIEEGGGGAKKCNINPEGLQTRLGRR